MKKLLFLFLFGTSHLFANNITPTTIKEVTVYLSGAQITRNVVIRLPIGTTEFTFNNLSPYIEESSIQLSGLKNASILSINYGINYLSKQDNSNNIELLKNELTSLHDSMQYENDLIAGYTEELSIIQTNRRLGNENQVVNLEKLQRFTAYYRKRSTEVKNLIYASQKKIKEYNAQISRVTKQLSEFNVENKIQSGEIKVKLNTISTVNLNLILKYNVTNAGWFPIYDLKAEDINSPLQLAYKAHVYQSTGNNWNDIKLTLSTSDPNTNNIKPDVNPKYLNFINRYSNYRSNRATKNYQYKYNPLVKTINGIVTDETGPIPGVSIIVKGTTTGTETDFDGKYSIKPDGGKDLVFSFVGMKTEIIPIHSSIINVSLDADNLLEEVVVSAYGTTSNASAGSTSGIRVRGNSSSSTNSTSLYIIDGIAMDKSSFEILNKDDIKTMEVLKGSTASSLYGSKARNGAVVITTKEGKTTNGDNIEEGITNTRFEIKKEYNIPTDGDITVIEIDNYSVPASFAYFAAPVVNENVFLTARFGNWEQYNLLPGEANIYFDGSYSGKTNINPQAITDSLTVSLGVDPSIAVKRTQPNNFKKKSFYGSNKVLNKSYQIELKNNKLSDINLVLIDRIPVSQNREIKIDNIDSGTADYDAKKGLLEWKVNLPAKSAAKYNFAYTIKYPKYKRVNL